MSRRPFTHRGTFRIEIYHAYSPHEFVRRAGQLLSAAPALVETLSRGESRRLWRRLFPPSMPAAATHEVAARAAVLVPTHLTTTDTRAADVRPALPAAPVISRDTPAPAPSRLATRRRRQVRTRARENPRRHEHGRRLRRVQPPA